MQVAPVSSHRLARQYWYWFTFAVVVATAVLLVALVFIWPMAIGLAVFIPVPGALILGFTFYTAVRGLERSYSLAVLLPSLVIPVIFIVRGGWDVGLMGPFWFFGFFGFLAVPLAAAVLIAHWLSVGVQRWVHGSRLNAGRGITGNPSLKTGLVRLGIVFAVPALALAAAFAIFVAWPPAGADTHMAAAEIAANLTPLLTKPGQKVSTNGTGNHATVAIYGVVATAEQDEVLRVARETLSTFEYRVRVSVYFYDTHRSRPLLRKVDLQQKESVP